ncbi:hypothetical protein [Streptomyces sp. NPDC004266]|uniref:hypothetical protein n=1 Tax=Streptomyces sp. NPDC004266 TaxID=3364693 RepID=UPI0036B126C6
MQDEGALERIATRRAELDLLEEELVEQLADVRVERDELVVAGRVVQRVGEQGFRSTCRSRRRRRRSRWEAGRCC